MPYLTDVYLTLAEGPGVAREKKLKKFETKNLELF